MNVVANWASRAATTRSHAAASAVPAPNADPSTAASTGLGVLQIARITLCANCARSIADSGAMRFIVVMSPPEQNAGPAPVNTIDSDVGVGVGGLDRLGQRDAELEVDGVALLGPVQRDGAHGAVVVDENRRCGDGGHYR